VKLNIQQALIQRGGGTGPMKPRQPGIQPKVPIPAVQGLEDER
jgi:hypothetical protein